MARFTTSVIGSESASEDWTIFSKTHHLRIGFLVANYFPPRKCELISGSGDLEDKFNPSSGQATFVQTTRTQNILKNHPNPVMLVFIG